jgi:hypothetical protein
MGFLPAKGPRFIFVACLALSVMGTVTFAATDIPLSDFQESTPVTDGSITGADADYTIDCLAEYTFRVRGCASLPSRKSMHTAFGTLLCTGIVASFSIIKIFRPTKAPDSKNTILLKLRI